MAIATIATDDDTERRQAVRPAQPEESAAPSDFYIIASPDYDGAESAVYGLDSAPFEVLWAWLDSVVKAEKRQGLLLSVLIRGLDALQSVQFFDASSGIDMSKYLFTRREDAEQALEAMKSAKSEGSEVGNESL